MRRAAAGFLITAVLTSCGHGAPSSPHLSTPQPGLGILTPPGDPFTGKRLYVDPSSSGRRAADARRATDPSVAAALDKIARQPTATWLGGWLPTSTISTTVRALIRRASAAHAYPVLVVYYIPELDCAKRGQAGAPTGTAYRVWVDHVAAGIGTGRAAVVVEPDALVGMGCLSAPLQTERLGLLRYAVRRLASNGRVAVYLDAGHAGWQPVTTMARRLADAGVRYARGFSLDVSNFDATAGEIAYGRAISARAGDKPFVVDTGRNGRGSNGQWCNPPGRALGEPPTALTGDDRTDALLWIKPPGESDGACNGGPPAGAFWVDYAVGLARRAAW